jgi:hypothetical protein
MVFIEQKSLRNHALVRHAIVVLGKKHPVSIATPINSSINEGTPYWPLLAATLLCYVLLTQNVKMLLLRLEWI